MTYDEMRAPMLECSKKLKPRTKSDSIRWTMRQFLRGRRFRFARKRLKLILGHHERWSAEGHAALNPWAQGWDAYLEWKRAAVATRPSRSEEG